jgi:hypothetical protein
MRQASAFADAESVFRSAQAERWPKAFAPIEIGLLATRQASAFAGAESVFRSAQAERWPKAFSPIEIGLLRRLRAKRRPSPAQRAFFGRRRPSVGRRPSRRLKSAFPGATRQASAFADAENVFRSAQADRWPKASGGRIHSAHPAPGVGLRRRRERFSVGAEAVPRSAQAVGRRPQEAEFIRRTPRLRRRRRSAQAERWPPTHSAQRRASAFAERFGRRRPAVRSA